MMGQHKHNPTAIAAANGMLPPKPKKLDKRESERFLESMIWAEIYNRTGMMLSPTCKEYTENFFTSLPNLWRKINIGMA